MIQVKLARTIALLSGVGLLLYALGLLFGLPLATQLWIWPNAPPLSLAFVGAWLAGAAAPLMWIGLSGQLAAMRGGALTGVVAGTACSLFLLSQRTQPGNERYGPFVIAFALAGVSAALGWAWSRRLLAAEDAPLPAAVRWAFLVFSAILLPVGLTMVLGVPRVFPLALRPDMAVLYGWFFLGSLVYYFYGFLRPSLPTARGAMLSFLVYDVLLIPSFAAHWPVVPPEFRPNLFVYLSVLIASAVFCAYFLLVDGRTRLVRSVSDRRLGLLNH